MKRSVALALVICGGCQSARIAEPHALSSRAVPSEASASLAPAVISGEPTEHSGLVEHVIPPYQQPRSGQPFAPFAPPWPDVWCVSEDGAWSSQLAAKHAPSGSSFLEPGPTCGWGTAAGRGSDKVLVGVNAGASKWDWNKRRRDTRKTEANLLLPIAWEHTATFDTAYAWNESPPYNIDVSIEGFTPPERKRRARALMADMMRQLRKPEAFARPMAELVGVAFDETGELAQRYLEQWSKLKPVLDYVIPLAPGFPRVANTADFPTDRAKKKGDQKFLLLAICPGGDGFRLAEMITGAFPLRKTELNTQALVVDAANLSVECPALPPADGGRSTARHWEVQDGYHLGVFSFPNIAEQMLGGAVLHDPQGTIVHTATFSIPWVKPVEGVPGRYHETAKTRVSKCGSTATMVQAEEGMWIELNCDVQWSDYMCDRQPEAEGTRIEFEVTAEHKITMKSHPVKYGGEGCWAQE